MQEIRDIHKAATEKGKSLESLLEPLYENIGELLVIPQKLNRHRAIDLLEEFAEKFTDLQADDEVYKGIEWLDKRCSDAVTPVTGDPRVQLDAAADAFKQQLDNISNIEYAAGLLLGKLKEFEESEEPDVIKAMRLLGVNFYTSIGDGIGVRAIEDVDMYIDEFYRTWERKL